MLFGVCATNHGMVRLYPPMFAWNLPMFDWFTDLNRAHGRFPWVCLQRPNNKKKKQQSPPTWFLPGKKAELKGSLSWKLPGDLHLQYRGRNPGGSDCLRVPCGWSKPRKPPGEHQNRWKANACSSTPKWEPWVMPHGHVFGYACSD